MKRASSTLPGQGQGQGRCRLEVGGSAGGMPTPRQLVRTSHFGPNFCWWTSTPPPASTGLWAQEREALWGRLPFPQTQPPTEPSLLLAWRLWSAERKGPGSRPALSRLSGLRARPARRRDIACSPSCPLRAQKQLTNLSSFSARCGSKSAGSIKTTSACHINEANAQTQSDTQKASSQEETVSAGPLSPLEAHSLLTSQSTNIRRQTFSLFSN